MRIVLATPLYPPEIAEPAPYMKELARRLSPKHSVTVVAYTRLPETVSGVRIVAVDKRRPVFLRLPAYFFALLQAARTADIVYAMNGASVELPVAFTSFIFKRPIIIRIGDTAAHARTRTRWLPSVIERLAFKRAKRVIDDSPLARPEVLPLESFPNEKFSAYELSWDVHTRLLEDIFRHATE